MDIGIHIYIYIYDVHSISHPWMSTLHSPNKSFMFIRPLFFSLCYFCISVSSFPKHGFKSTSFSLKSTVTSTTPDGAMLLLERASTVFGMNKFAISGEQIYGHSTSIHLSLFLYKPNSAINTPQISQMP